jgi:hypothetical protein
VVRPKGEKGRQTYEVDGVTLPDDQALREKLLLLKAGADEDKVKLGVVLQVFDGDIRRFAETGGRSLIQEPTSCLTSAYIRTYTISARPTTPSNGESRKEKRKNRGAGAGARIRRDSKASRPDGAGKSGMTRLPSNPVPLKAAARQQETGDDSCIFNIVCFLSSAPSGPKSALQ